MVTTGAALRVGPAPDLTRQGKRGAKPEGRIRLGSEDHLRLFCLELLETHDPYRPAMTATATGAGGQPMVVLRFDAPGSLDLSSSGTTTS